MGSVGNYIHYRSKNYRDYGINRITDRKTSINAEDALTSQHNQIKGKINSLKTPDLTNLEAQINNVFQDFSKGSGNKIYDTVLAMMEEKFGLALGEIDVNTRGVISQNAAAAREKLDSTKNKINFLNNEYYVTKRRIDHIVAEINRLMGSLDEVEDATTITALKNILGENNNKINKIMTQLTPITEKQAKILKKNKVYPQKAVFENGVKVNESYAFNKTNGNKDLGKNRVANQNKKTLKQLQEELNKCYQLLIPTTLVQQQGYLLECLLQIVPLYMDGLAEEIIDKKIEDIIKMTNSAITSKGANTKVSKMTFNGKVVDLNTLKELLPKGWVWTAEGPEGGGMFIKKGAQQKIDVGFTINDIEKITYNISAKNYGDFAHIGLVDGAPLSISLLENNEDFSNHFLNLTAWHPKEGEVKIADEKLIEKYQQKMKMTLLIEAISGTKADQEAGGLAEIIVLNNSKTGGYKIIHIKSILEKMFDNLQNGALNSSNVSLNYNDGTATSHLDIIGNDYHFKNHFVTNDKSRGGIRIAKLLADVHKYKISASININTV